VETKAALHGLIPSSLNNFVFMIIANLRLVLVFLMLTLFSQTVMAQVVGDDAFKMYTVVKGDTYFKIAKKFNCAVEDIQKANGNKTIIKIGEQIKIPVKGVAKPKVEDANIKSHAVVKGETLSKIAAKYETTADKIRKLNELKSDQLKIGQLLKIPVKAETLITHEATEEKPTEKKDTVAKSPKPVVTPKPREAADVNPGMPEKAAKPTNADFVVEKEEVANAKVVSKKMEDTRTHVMHPTIPKGNIIVVVNPASGRMAYCKVVDNYTPKQYGGSGLIITPAVADKIGLSGTSESVKIKYAAP
jgi:LysM repeat protein